MHKKLRYLLSIWLSGILIFSFYGCGQKAENMALEKSSVSNKPTSAERQSAPEEAGYNSSADGYETYGGNFDSNINQLNAKIIRSADIVIETKNYDQCISSILNDVKNLGGYPENVTKQGRGLYLDSGNRTAELVVRIPSEAFDTFIGRTNQFGNVISETVKGENISEQYADIEARVKVLKIRQERLMALMEQSNSLEHLFEVEKELAEVGYEIEKLTGSLNKYDNLIEHSTIYFYVHEVEEFKDIAFGDSFGEKISTTFNNSVKQVIVLLKSFVILLAALIPYFIVLAVVLAVVIPIAKAVKKLKKGVKAKIKANETDSAEEPTKEMDKKEKNSER